MSNNPNPDVYRAIELLGAGEVLADGKRRYNEMRYGPRRGRAVPADEPEPEQAPNDGVPVDD